MKYYFCTMTRRVLFVLFIILGTFSMCDAQTFIKTSDLFPNKLPDSKAGELNINQDKSVDTLISRALMANRNLGGGMWGLRIQIYRRSTRNAREESNKVRAEFMIEFPDIASYADYEKPGYFLVRAGDYRTKIEGTKALYRVRRKYPNAILVPDIINFPDLNKN